MKILFTILILVTIWTHGHASGDHEGSPGPPGPQGEPGIDGIDGIDGVDGINGIDGLAGIAGTNGLNLTEVNNYLDEQGYWTNSEISEMFAASSAMSGLDFDSTTNKLQLGLSIGGYGSDTDMAVGIAKSWDSDKTGDVLFSFKTNVLQSGKDSERPWTASAVWKVQIP